MKNGFDDIGGAIGGHVEIDGGFVGESVVKIDTGGGGSEMFKLLP